MGVAGQLQRQLRQKADHEREEKQSPEEKRAYKKMLSEAKTAGATLANEGKGGLSSSLVLGVMRRDEFTCKKCGMKENISVHHKSEHLEDPKAKARSRLLHKEGRVDTRENLVTICAGCHDDIHEEDRAKAGKEEER